jgi:hypothetical protein
MEIGPPGVLGVYVNSSKLAAEHRYSLADPPTQLSRAECRFGRSIGGLVKSFCTYKG